MEHENIVTDMLEIAGDPEDLLEISSGTDSYNRDYPVVTGFQTTCDKACCFTSRFFAKIQDFLCIH
eukprot:1375777-Amorphochlora_amoeboformis.AAC.1